MTCQSLVYADDSAPNHATLCETREHFAEQPISDAQIRFLASARSFLLAALPGPATNTCSSSAQKTITLISEKALLAARFSKHYAIILSIPPLQAQSATAQKEQGT
jgi:hypothetical protein